MLRDLRFLESDTQITNLSLNGGGGVIKFSPDGEWIIFQDGGTIRRVRVEGGASQEITSQGQVNPRVQASHALIGPDLYFVSAGDLQVHKTAFSGESNDSVMITDGSLYYSAPSAINDEEDRLLITLCGTSNFTNWGDCDVGLLDVATGESTVLVQTAHDATYSSSGHIVFVRDASLWAAPYDTNKRQITGSQVPVIQGVEGNSFRGNTAYSLSETGRLIYSPGADVYQGTQRMDITWVEKDGVRTALPLPEGIYGSMNLSPEEDRLAFTVWNGEANDVWVWNIEQEILSRLTFDGDASTPIWTTDGRNIIFTKTRSPFGLWSVSSNGTGQPQQLTESQAQVWPETITEQGEILFSTGGQRKLYSSSDIDDRIQNLLDIGPSQVRSSRLSADGKWLLYTSNESGDYETFIRPWPNVNDGKWQASRQGGGQPLWDQDDQTIYFWSSAGQQFSVEYQILSDADSGQQSYRFQEPIEMFAYNEPRNNQSLPGWAYSQKRDKFLMVAQGGLSTGEPIDVQILDQQTNLIIVENWFEELSSVAPSDSY
jgi:Tol biopolymer transport system component